MLSFSGNFWKWHRPHHKPRLGSRRQANWLITEMFGGGKNTYFVGDEAWLSPQDSMRLQWTLSGYSGICCCAVSLAGRCQAPLRERPELHMLRWGGLCPLPGRSRAAGTKTAVFICTPPCASSTQSPRTVTAHEPQSTQNPLGLPPLFRISTVRFQGRGNFSPSNLDGDIKEYLEGESWECMGVTRLWEQKLYCHCDIIISIFSLKSLLIVFLLGVMDFISHRLLQKRYQEKRWPAWTQGSKPSFTVLVLYVTLSNTLETCLKQQGKIGFWMLKMICLEYIQT